MAITRMSAPPPATRTGDTIAPFAWLPVLAIAAAVGLLLGLTSSNYGPGFDEMYFLVAGRDHPAWGYFDQPPLVPMLTALMDSWFPGSTVALRLPVTIAAALGVVVTALIARELGGRRPAQMIAAGTFATSGVITISHWIATYTLDPFFWTVITWLVVRWVRMHRAGLHNDWPLLWAGVVTAVSLQTKFMIPAFWAAVALAALILGPREMLRRPKLWIGAGIAVLCTVPTLIWQAANGWPYTQMGAVVASESGGALAFLASSYFGAGVVVGVVALTYGFWRLLRAPALRPYRFLGVALIGVFVVFLVTDGRFYYSMGLYALPFAVAAVELPRRNLARWWRPVGWLAFAVSAVLIVVQLPIYPKDTVEDMPVEWQGIPLGSTFASGELPPKEIGELAGRVYAELPPEERDRTAVFAPMYTVAAAVDYYGRADGIPQVYSGHRGYWYFGAPPDTMDKVLYVDAEAPGDVIAPHFATSRPLVEGAITLYEGRKETWEQIWPTVQAQ